LGLCVRSSSTIDRTVQEWTDAHWHALDLVLSRGGVRVAVAHGMAALGEEVVAIDVHARSQTAVLEDWVWSLHGEGIRNTAALLRPDLSRAGCFVEERTNSVGPDRGAEYHLLAFDRGRFVARVIAQPTEPSKTLGRRLDRVSTSIVSSLVEADRRLRAALPTCAGYAVLGPYAELEYADAAGMRWLDVRAVRDVASHEILRLHHFKKPGTSYVAFGSHVTIMGLSGNEAGAHLVRFRPADAMPIFSSARLPGALDVSLTEHGPPGPDQSASRRRHPSTQASSRTH
jgi:hypothetical protein